MYARACKPTRIRRTEQKNAIYGTELAAPLIHPRMITHYTYFTNAGIKTWPSVALKQPHHLPRKNLDIEITPPPPPLSPAEITTPETHATINGMIASVSPIKPSKYFDGELTDGDNIIRFVGFRSEQRQLLHSFCEKKKPITIKKIVRSSGIS